MLLIFSKLKTKNIRYIIFAHKEETYPDLHFIDSEKTYIKFKFLLISELAHFYFVEKYKNEKMDIIDELSKFMEKEDITEKDFKISSEYSITIL